MQPLTAGQCATLACLLEVSVPKPGNVHRGADFEDVTFADFAVSAAVIGPAMDAAVTAGVGATVLEAVRCTAHWTRTNTNLGMALLLAPLAAAFDTRPLRDGVRRVLAQLTPDDSRHVYEAIRLSAAGGLGKVEQMDVEDAPPAELRAAMQLAADRDFVARQYANDFTEVFDVVLPWLVESREAGATLAEAVIRTHVRLLAHYGDSLIRRKCGVEVSEEAAARAAAVLRAAEIGQSNYQQALADLDFWLRSDGHRRNPGTTADMIAAGLFVCLAEGQLTPPLLV